MTEWGLYYQHQDLVLPPLETTMYNYMQGLEKHRQHSSSYKAALAYWREKATSLPNSPPLPIVTGKTLKYFITLHILILFRIEHA